MILTWHLFFKIFNQGFGALFHDQRLQNVLQWVTLDSQNLQSVKIPHLIGKGANIVIEQKKVPQVSEHADFFWKLGKIVGR
jgi:hypothetical protein